MNDDTLRTEAMKREYDFSHAERGRFRRASGPLRLPAGRTEVAWAGRKGPLGRFVNQETDKTLNAYRAQPHLVAEHANQEHDTAHGGYAHRQLYELVQNSADALSHADTGQSILIRLTERFLYCADDGKAIDEDGVKGLMFAHMSSKRGTSEIGRFGMGFQIRPRCNRRSRVLQPLGLRPVRQKPSRRTDRLRGARG